VELAEQGARAFAHSPPVCPRAAARWVNARVKIGNEPVARVATGTSTRLPRRVRKLDPPANPADLRGTGFLHPTRTSAIEKRGRLDLRSSSWRIRPYSCGLLASPCTGCTDPREGELFCSSPAGRDSWNSSGTNATYLGPEPGRTSACVTPFAERLRPWTPRAVPPSSSRRRGPCRRLRSRRRIHDAERAPVGCDEHIAWLPVRVLGQKSGRVGRLAVPKHEQKAVDRRHRTPGQHVTAAHGL